MNARLAKWFAIAAILSVTGGCGHGGGVTKALGGDDPVSDLKLAMNAFSKTSTASNFAYDVTKTDSLVSPYIGTVTYAYLAEPAEKPGDQLPDEETSATFAYQDKKWVLKKLCEKMNYHVDP